jgi:hypothetical protein
MIEIKTHHNSTYPKGGFSYSNDSFVVNQTLVFQIKFCGKSPALRVAAKRQAVRKPFFLLKFSHFPITTTQITPFKKSAFLGCKFNWVENKV